MKRHELIRLSVLGAVAGMAIAAAAPANAQSSCPAGTFVVPGGAYLGPAWAVTSQSIPTRLSQFVPNGYLCVFPYDGPFATPWVNAMAICDHGLLGGGQWLLPNERELYEIFQRGYNYSLGMTAGSNISRYWSNAFTVSNPHYSTYTIMYTRGPSRGSLSIISTINYLSVYVAFRCVKPAREFLPVVPTAPATGGNTTKKSTNTSYGRR